MWLSFIISSVVVAAPPDANALEESLRRARVHYSQLLFPEAVAEANRALRQANNHTDLVTLYELKGLALAAMGKRQAARKTFLRLLMIEPEHQLPDWVSPRMAKQLERARDERDSLGWLRVSASAASVVRTGMPIVVEVRIDNDPLGMVDRARIVFRVAGTTATESLEVPATRESRVQIPLDTEALGALGALEYWCILLDRHGSELASLGSVADPTRIRWEPEPVDESVTARAFGIEEAAPWQTWWFWTAAGAVLATTAGVSAYLLWPDGPCDGVSRYCGNTINR